jgi:hypothetical protein
MTQAEEAQQHLKFVSQGPKNAYRIFAGESVRDASW